jgi:aerobic-type carbon monoxide dehydrogenase small subunit (CoxS/CutS family)
MPASRSPIDVAFTLNGLEVAIAIDPAERLLDTLRYRFGMTGTKEGCGEGECGACTVHVDDIPMNSCLIPTYQMRGARVRTVESIDPADVSALLGSGATQCGACTPGVVMTAVWVREHPELLESHTLRELMAGNLCRCTGYDGIIDGVGQTLEEDGR